MKQLILLLIVSFMGACTSFHSSSQQLVEIADVSDSIETSFLYNDSVDNIIKESTNIRVFEMMGLVRDSIEALSKDSLFNFPIENIIEDINLSDAKDLNEIVNSKLYRQATTSIRQPFNPNYALRFSKDSLEAYYFVSFGTGEIAISDAKGIIKFFQMRDLQIIDSIFKNITKEN